MHTLPDNSYANYRDGHWFIFNIDGAIIHAWGSNQSGLERVDVNRKLVCEQRSTSRTSELQFTLHGKNYSVTFHVTQIWLMQLICCLWCNGELQGAYLSRYVAWNRNSVRLAVWLVLVSIAACTSAIILWSAPWNVLLLSWPAVVLANWLIHQQEFEVIALEPPVALQQLGKSHLRLPG